MKEKLKGRKGITLIALVITIIVLLILAGVSIAMLTGKNGILNQAQEAKEQTEYKSAEEKVKLTIMGARADDGQMTVEELKREVGYQGGSVTGDTFPVQVQMDGHIFILEAIGKITKTDTLGEVTGSEENNTTVYDKLGNQVVVPSGFKVQNPDKTVPDGIIIEDVSYEATKGSEFVWIPVGPVNKVDEDPVTIKLGRYNFDASGNATDLTDTSYTEDTAANHSSRYGNIIAKDIEVFKTSAVNNEGYYIGRYEARTETKRTNSGNELTQLTEKPGDYVYNWVTQSQASERSQKMYVDNSNFTSDLVNSYAWDTAITFLQVFDNREQSAKTKPYSQQNSLNTGNLAEKGTNQLGTKDVICNVYDMASNTREWSTETSNTKTWPCVIRGGCWSINNRYTRDRYTKEAYSQYDDYYCSFRPILYL